MDLMRSAEGRRQRGNARSGIEIPVSTRIWLISALCLGLGAGTAIGALTYGLKAASASYEAPLRNLQESARQEDTARLLAVIIKKHVQEWEEILLRECNWVDLAQYSGQFRAATSNLSEMGSALQASMTAPAVRQVTEECLRAQSGMRNKCELALRIFTDAIALSADETGQRVKGPDRAVRDRIGQVGDELVQRANAAFVYQKNVVARKTWVVGLSVLAPFALLLAPAGFTMGRSRDRQGPVASWLGHLMTGPKEECGKAPC